MFTKMAFQFKLMFVILQDLGWINRSCVNDQAVKGRIQDLLSSRFVHPDHQINWLARSIQCIDLTTLAGTYFFHCCHTETQS